MRELDYSKLFEDLQKELLSGATSVGVLGLTTVALRLIASLTSCGLGGAVQAIYTADPTTELARLLPFAVRPYSALEENPPEVLVVAADETKEDLIRAAAPFVRGTPKVIVAGYGHFAFRDPVFVEERNRLLVPSLANGYPNSLTHVYQCLVNAARLRLEGVIAEFGMFKGGTTMFISRVVERLGMQWRVIGFDTFDGFPPRRSILDMYDHADCVFTDLSIVQRYLENRNVEIVPGDIAETCQRLTSERLVLSFMDTDNYTPAKAALEIVQRRTVVGGAIVFDHFTGTDRFRYTLGERMAGAILLEDPHYFHLHGTGVFYRQS